MNAQARLVRGIIAATAIAVSLAAGSFAYARWWPSRAGAALTSAHPAKVYTCPMHPNYRSDHPGDCPICGMRLEPKRAAGATKLATVYACPMHPDQHSYHPGNCPVCGMQFEKERGSGGARSQALPDGAVQVSPERQQAIGVRLGVVNRVAGTRVLRTTGRVAPDENRTYPIVAGASGWIRTLESVTAGDVVKEHQELASFVPPQPEFDSAQQSYYTALEMLYRDASALPGLQPRSQPHGSTQAGAAIERMADGLRNLGVPTSQLREMARRRVLVQDIRVESPVDGFVLKRNVSPGLRFDRGFEFYRIADLNRVWILADVYRDQLPLIHGGARARIASAEAGRALPARVSASEPVFDDATLTI